MSAPQQPSPAASAAKAVPVVSVVVDDPVTAAILAAFNAVLQSLHAWGLANTTTK